MSNGPRILLGGDKDGMRLVRVEEGERISHVLEVADGCDALGCERWREMTISGTAMKSIFSFLIKVANERDGNGKL